MSRALLVLYNDDMRARAIKMVQTAEKETRVTFQEPKRTLPQNSRFWAMLTDISEQRDHFGRKYTPEEWRTLFMSALGREMTFAPALDGQGFVPLGHHSSELSIAEMAALITFMEAWGAENGVKFNEPELRGSQDDSAPQARGGFPATKGTDAPARASGRPPSVPLSENASYQADVKALQDFVDGKIDASGKPT